MRSALILALLFICPSLASAQLRFVQPLANLGELRGGPVYPHRFEFINDAPTPIEISDIRLGCGCLQPVLDKRIYQPGEKGTLLMHLRTLGQPSGPRTWQAHVPYRHGDKMQEVALLLSATISTEVTVEPSIVALTVVTTLKQELTLTDQRPLPLKVTSVLASSPAIRVNTQTQGKGVTKVFLEVSRSALTATRQEEMINIYTNDASYLHLQVPITLMKANRVEVSATPARVEIVGAGSQLVRLRALGDQAVRIEKVDIDQPGVKCTWAAGPGKDATLRIAVDAAQVTAAKANVRVQLLEPTPTVITIPVVLHKE